MRLVAEAEPPSLRMGTGLRPWEALAADAVGEVIEFWGFKRNQGRVWTLLYLRGGAWTATDIQSEMKLSKAAVSIIVRELERWRVVRRVRAVGEESWRFVAERDLLGLVGRVLAEREAALIARVRGDLERAEALANGDRAATREDMERIRRLRRVAEFVDRSLSAFLRTARLDATGMQGALDVLERARRKLRRG